MRLLAFEHSRIPYCVRCKSQSCSGRMMRMMRVSCREIAVTASRGSSARREPLLRMRERT